MRIARESVHHPDESLRWMTLALPAFRGVLHRHSHLELTWIQRGQGLRWVGDSVEPFVDGDLVLVGSETAHLWTSRGDTPSPGCAASVLQFPPTLVPSLGLRELTDAGPLLARAAAGLEVRGATRSEVQHLMARMPGASPARRVALFIAVLAALLDGPDDLRPLSDLQQARARSGLRRVDRVLSWIESNLARELRVDDAAAVAHVSPAAFARFFRREVDKSFVAYVNDARCGWAALQLTQGREPIAQIAQACGFATLSHFGEQFRRRYGLSPRDFRAAGGSSRPTRP